MELPDFMSYANKFSASDFVDKISRIAKRAGAKLVYVALILYYTLQSDKVSKADKAIIIRLSKWFDEEEISEIDELKF